MCGKKARVVAAFTTVVVLAAAWTLAVATGADAAQMVHGSYAITASDVDYSMTISGTGRLARLGRFTLSENLRQIDPTLGPVATPANTVSTTYRGLALFTFAHGVTLRAEASTVVTYRTDLAPFGAGVKVRGQSLYTLSGGRLRFADATGKLDATFTGRVTNGGYTPPTMLRLAGPLRGRIGSGYHRQLRAQLARRHDTVYASSSSLEFFFTVRAQSSPSGGAPSGSATLHWGGGMNPSLIGSLTCLAVHGDVAVLGFLSRDSLGLTPPVQDAMEITERAGHGPDTVLLQDPRISGQAPRSPSDCSPITQPTSRYNVHRGGVTAIFDASMPTNHECQAIEDINGVSVIQNRTVSCQSARAVVRAVNYILLPVALFRYTDTVWSDAYVAATPSGQFRCQRRTQGLLEVRCRRGRAQITWLMLG